MASGASPRLVRKAFGAHSDFPQELPDIDLGWHRMTTDQVLKARVKEITDEAAPRRATRSHIGTQDNSDSSASHSLEPFRLHAPYDQALPTCRSRVASVSPTCLVTGSPAMAVPTKYIVFCPQSPGLP